MVDLLKNLLVGEGDFFLELLLECVLFGVDEVVYVKVGFLSVIVKGEDSCEFIFKEKVVELLGNMYGGYNIVILVELFDDKVFVLLVVKELKYIFLMFDVYYDVEEKYKVGNEYVIDIIKFWVEGEWFMLCKLMDDKIIYIVFKVIGEINIDDLLLVLDVWFCLDIFLYVLVVYKMFCEGLELEELGVKGLMV